MGMEFLGITVKTYALSFAAIFAGFAARWILNGFLFKMIAASKKTRTELDDIVFKALEKPGGWACVITGIYAATIMLPLPVEPVNVRKFADSLSASAFVALGIWLCVLIFDSLMDYWSRSAESTESKLDDQLVPIVRSSGKTFLTLIGIMLFLQNMGYSITSLLAGLGLGGMAVALASKDTIANLFGSIVVFVDRPFHVGDWIEMNGIEGTVEEVGLRTTRIRTFANSLITVPNASLTTTAINNWSRMRKRRIKMTIGVKYDTPPAKLEQAVQKIRDIISADDNIRNDFYLVNFDSFGPYSLDIFVYCFTATTVWGEFLQAKQDFMLKVMRAFEELGVEFAYPTQTLHVESLPGNAGGESRMDN